MPVWLVGAVVVLLMARALVSGAYVSSCSVTGTDPRRTIRFDRVEMWEAKVQADPDDVGRPSRASPSPTSRRSATRCREAYDVVLERDRTTSARSTTAASVSLELDRETRPRPRSSAVLAISPATRAGRQGARRVLPPSRPLLRDPDGRRPGRSRPTRRWPTSTHCSASPTRRPATARRRDQRVPGSPQTPPESRRLAKEASASRG